MCLGDNEKCSSKMREMCVVKKKKIYRCSGRMRIVCSRK
jgi:hypothetical protein